MQSRIPAYHTPVHETHALENDPQLIGLIGMIWHMVIDQQVETSVPCVTVPVCAVAQLMLSVCDFRGALQHANDDLSTLLFF